MLVICDAEADGLYPSKFWCIVAKNYDTGEEFVFDRPYEDGYQKFISFAKQVEIWVGHNFLGYDLVHLNRLLPGLDISPDAVIDTLVVSRLLDFDRAGGHSLEQYGSEFGVSKVQQEQWDTYDPNMLERCRTDVQINQLVYEKYLPYINSPRWHPSLSLEHYIAGVCNELHDNGFYFNVNRARDLLGKINSELTTLERVLLDIFPKRSKFIREYIPKYTKFNTIAKNSVPRGQSDLSLFNGGPFSTFSWEEFNPGSPKQRMDRLWEAGWRPINKTKGHKDFIKSQSKDKERKEYFAKYGWVTDDENLATLPPDAPEGVKKLTRYLLLKPRANKIEKEWIGNVNPVTGRVHGRYNHIGAWTHRMSHSEPNMGNIPKFDAKQPDKTPYSDEMRALWGVPNDKYLIGVDAESIQLRVFAHYVNDPELTRAICSGDKKLGTDPHTLHWRMWEDVGCQSRNDSKTALYAAFLNASAARIAEVFVTSRENGKEALKILVDKYPGLRYIKREIIPRDAIRGYFEGFDGRYVRCRGSNEDERAHYMLGGYLQNGEAVIMKRATRIWMPELHRLKIPFKIVNYVHDEWQIEVERNYELALEVAKVVANSLSMAGSDLNLRCPMQGSILNSHDKIAIGDTWLETH